MRASATSKISSAANHAAAQAKPNAAKADEASPFAMLVDIASKDDVRGRLPQKDSSNATDKGADDKSAKPKDNQDTAPQPSSSAPAKSSPKPEKSDKSPGKDKAETSDDTDPQASATDPHAQDRQVCEQVVMPANPQNPPAPVPVAQTVIPVDGESDDPAIDAAASIAPKPQADMKAASNGKPETKPGLKADTRTGTPAKTPVKPSVAAQPPAVADDSGEEDTEMQIAEPASQPAPEPAKAAAPVQATATTNIPTAKAADDKGQPVQASDAKNAGVPRQDTAQVPAPADTTRPQDIAAKTDTSDATPDNVAKNAGIKSTAPKTRTVQAEAADKSDAAKSSVASSDQPKSDTAQTAAPQTDLPNVANAPKPQPAAQAIFAINSIAAPQAAQSSPVAAATAHAHVQVSAQAAPDLPALAVDIAAKSKSGAKQFDIRLDPPELGRVEVRLSIDASGKASAHLSADQPQTLNLLQKDAPVLTRALREAGLDVSQDGLNFSLRQQNENSSGNAGNNGRRGSSRGLPLSASIKIDATAGAAAYRGIANGRLDIRV